MEPIKISGDFNELLSYVEHIGFGIKREDYPLTSLFLYAVLFTFNEEVTILNREK